MTDKYHQALFIPYIVFVLMAFTFGVLNFEYVTVLFLALIAYFLVRND